MSEPVSYSCYKSECSHLSFMSLTRYVCHLRDNHSHEPNFKVTCPAKACFRSYSVISSLNSHMCRKHKYDIEDEVHLTTEGKENRDPETISVKELALYALKTQELNQLSDSATDRVLESTSHLLQQNEENLKKRVRTCLQNNGVNVTDIDGLEDVLKSPPCAAVAMKQLRTTTERNRYLKNKLHMVVS